MEQNMAKQGVKKFSLKDDLFNDNKVSKIAFEIQNVYPSFNTEAFKKDVLVDFPKLELKERIYHIRTMLKKHLPEEYVDAVNILLNALPSELDPNKNDDDFGDFIYAPYADYISAYGCTAEYLEFSLYALRELTKRFSVEFAIRDFINDFPHRTLEMLKECTVSKNYHERRLVSEGLRPKLPWGKKLTLDYKVSISYLDRLFYDDTRYVTRSVANHLNDIAKIDPSLVISTLKRWQNSTKQNPKEMDYITSHALRTLIKKGDEKAFALLGYVKYPSIVVNDLCVYSKIVNVGESLIFNLEIEAKEETKLIIDYIIHFRTKLGTLNPKIHKLKRVKLMKGDKVTFYKKHRFKADMSTRNFYEGEHRVEVQINGMVYRSENFILRYQ